MLTPRKVARPAANHANGMSDIGAPQHTSLHLHHFVIACAFEVTDACSNPEIPG
jgi:hypothetical protein